jgi:hypothetical protein
VVEVCSEGAGRQRACSITQPPPSLMARQRRADMVAHQVPEDASACFRAGRSSSCSPNSVTLPPLEPVAFELAPRTPLHAVAGEPRASIADLQSTADCRWEHGDPGKLTLVVRKPSGGSIMLIVVLRALHLRRPISSLPVHPSRHRPTLSCGRTFLRTSCGAYRCAFNAREPGTRLSAAWAWPSASSASASTHSRGNSRRR